MSEWRELQRQTNLAAKITQYQAFKLKFIAQHHAWQTRRAHYETLLKGASLTEDSTCTDIGKSPPSLAEQWALMQELEKKITATTGDGIESLENAIGAWQQFEINRSHILACLESELVVSTDGEDGDDLCATTGEASVPAPASDNSEGQNNAILAPRRRSRRKKNTIPE